MRYCFLIALALMGCKERNLLGEVNDQVNARPYVLGKHDCRAYVEEKYEALKALGYDDMQVLYGLTPDGQQHVVLYVQEWFGRHYLDNMTPDMDNTTLQIQARFDPASNEWHEIMAGAR